MSGSVGKIDNGIVSVNAYGVYNNITFPLIVKVFKPKGALKASDKYKTKIELAAEIITELIDEGFNIELVLADSLYGESSQFVHKLTEYHLAYVVAIRNNHGVWLPAYQNVRALEWCKFERNFSNEKAETRYIREIVYGKKRAITYWEITTDPENFARKFYFVHHDKSPRKFKEDFRRLIWYENMGRIWFSLLVSKN